MLQTTKLTTIKTRFMWFRKFEPKKGDLVYCEYMGGYRRIMVWGNGSMTPIVYLGCLDIVSYRDIHPKNYHTEILKIRLATRAESLEFYEAIVSKLKED